MAQPQDDINRVFCFHQHVTLLVLPSSATALKLCSPNTINHIIIIIDRIIFLFYYVVNMCTSSLKCIYFHFIILIDRRWCGRKTLA